MGSVARADLLAKGFRLLARGVPVLFSGLTGYTVFNFLSDRALILGTTGALPWVFFVGLVVSVGIGMYGFWFTSTGFMEIYLNRQLDPAAATTLLWGAIMYAIGALAYGGLLTGGGPSNTFFLPMMVVATLWGFYLAPLRLSRRWGQHRYRRGLIYLFIGLGGFLVFPFVAQPLTWLPYGTYLALGLALVFVAMLFWAVMLLRGTYLEIATGIEGEYPIDSEGEEELDGTRGWTAALFRGKRKTPPEGEDRGR